VLTKGFVTFVSPEDAHHLQSYNWYAAERNDSDVVYVVRAIHGEKLIRLHRVILGEPSNDIDHKDHNGLNNRRENLRPCSQSQNNANGRQQPGSSGFRGVYFDKESATGRFGHVAKPALRFTHARPADCRPGRTAPCPCHARHAFATRAMPLPRVPNHSDPHHTARWRLEAR
jgi:hypothetical protein